MQGTVGWVRNEVSHLCFISGQKLLRGNQGHFNHHSECSHAVQWETRQTKAPLRAPNRFLFLADNLSKTTSLSFLSSICHGGSDNLPFRCFHSFPYLYPLFRKQHILPRPHCTICFLIFSAMLVSQKTGLRRLYHLVLLLFCSELGSASGRHWQGIGGKEVGWFSCTHTAPSLPHCCSGVASSPQATRPLFLFYFFF